MISCLQIFVLFLAQNHLLVKGVVLLYYKLNTLYVSSLTTYSLVITKIGIQNEMAKLESKYYLVYFHLKQNLNLSGTGQNVCY